MHSKNLRVEIEKITFRFHFNGEVIDGVVNGLDRNYDDENYAYSIYVPSGDADDGYFELNLCNRICGSNYFQDAYVAFYKDTDAIAPAQLIDLDELRITYKYNYNFD